MHDNRQYKWSDQYYKNMHTTNSKQILMYSADNVNDSDFATAVNNGALVNTIALI